MKNPIGERSRLRYETICVEKAVTDGPSTGQETNETLYEAFRTHVKLKHAEEFNLAAMLATERHEANNAFSAVASSIQ